MGYEPSKLNRLRSIAINDARMVAQKNREYGDSWCARGGQQAFAVIWRKMDRIETILKQMNNGYDIFKAWAQNPGDIRDDIRDARQYLLLLEEHLESQVPVMDEVSPRALLALAEKRVREEDEAAEPGPGYVDQG